MQAALRQLESLLSQVKEQGHAHEALVLIGRHFPDEVVPMARLQLDEAQRIVRVSTPVPEPASWPAPQALQGLINSLCELSMRDGLTGVFNRRHFDDHLETLLRRAQRTLEPCSVILGDVDHFKRVNDQFGHPVGDRVLRSVAAAFAGCLRATDVIARYGGEEFVAALPDTSAAGAVKVAERIRRAVAEERESIGQDSLSVTISLGVAAFVPGDEMAAAPLLARADAELYRAKRDGRNRTCCSAADLERTQPTGVTTDERRELLG